MLSMLFRYAYKMESDGRQLSFFFRDDLSASVPFSARTFVFRFQDSMAYQDLPYTVTSDLGAELLVVHVPMSTLFLALFRSVKCSIRCTNRKIYSQVYEISQIPPKSAEKLEAKSSAHAGV